MSISLTHTDAVCRVRGRTGHVLSDTAGSFPQGKSQLGQKQKILCHLQHHPPAPFDHRHLDQCSLGRADVDHIPQWPWRRTRLHRYADFRLVSNLELNFRRRYDLPRRRALGKESIFFDSLVR